MVLFQIAVIAVSLIVSGEALAQQRSSASRTISATAIYDQSEAYELGAIPSQSTTVTFGQPDSRERIRTVNLPSDSSELLGCDAIDPKKLTVSTLNDPQFVDEVVGEYSNTELFRRMAQLMLQSPSLVGAIQATLTAGTNRAKLKEDRCRTAEALADGRNIRLREEARRLCVQREIRSGDPTKCLGDNDTSTLKRYVDLIVAEPRWSQDFHSLICQATEANRTTPEQGCFWVALLPNIAFNSVTGESQVNQPVVSSDRLFEAIEISTSKVLRDRLDLVQKLVIEHSYSKVLGDISSGYDSSPSAQRDHTDMTRYIVMTHPVSACGSGGRTITYRDGIETASDISVVAADDFIAQMNSGNAQIARILNSGGIRGGSVSSTTTGAASDKRVSLDSDKAVQLLLRVAERAAACIAARNIHGHVDVRLSQLALGDQQAALRSLAQGVAAKTVKGILNGIVAKLEDIAGQRASPENSNSAISLNPEMARFLQAQIEVMKRRLYQLEQVSANFGDIEGRVSRINALYDDKIEASLRESQVKFSRVPAVSEQSDAAAMGAAQRR